MVKRCGCTSDECSCAIFPGQSIELGGRGDTTKPYVVNSYAVPRIAGRERLGGQVTVGGSGMQDDPYMLSMTIDPSVNVAPKRTLEYTSPGTYTFQRTGEWLNVKVIRVSVMGGGQAGQQGEYLTTGYPVYGGKGGNGAGLTTRVMLLPDTCTRFTIIVGAGGVGGGNWNGPSQTPPPGPDGTPSSIGFYNAAGILLCEAVGRAGTSTEAGAGTVFGQPAGSPGTQTGSWSYPSGAAGGSGAGAGSGPNGTLIPDPEKAGGKHLLYDGKVTWPAMMGYGGDGGTGGGVNIVTFGLAAGNRGSNGYGFGAGGGGGGAGGKAGVSFGGPGGNGTGGFVTVQEL